jgi:hypothetical protein
MATSTVPINPINPINLIKHIKDRNSEKMSNFPEMEYKPPIVDEVEVDANATSLDLLQAVYRNPDVPLSVRMRAAGMAIPYEMPRLSVVASINDPAGFAERLERAIERSGVRPLMIEHRAIEHQSTPQPGNVTGPMTGTDRKMRRL